MCMCTCRLKWHLWLGGSATQLFRDKEQAHDNNCGGMNHDFLAWTDGRNIWSRVMAAVVVDRFRVYIIPVRTWANSEQIGP